MAGYSGTPLAKKLGIKAGMQVKLINIPGNYFELLEMSPSELHIISKKGKDLDLVHLFVKDEKEIRQLDPLKEEIRKEGMIWVSWQKKKVKEEGAANENMVRNKALAIGLVDIKVCAVDEIWSGLKLVWRKENR